MLILILLYVAMPTINSAPEDVDATDMEEVIFNCNSDGQPEVTYEWFFTNTSGKLF